MIVVGTNKFYSEVKGDLFSCSEDYILHGTNLRGKMGAGVAAIVARKFPNACAIYQKACNQRTVQLGSSLICPRENGKIIVNLFSQRELGADARLSAVEVALDNLSEQLHAMDAEVAMPMIGCGIGGLNWLDVSPLVQKFAAVNKIKTVVYYL